MGLSKGKEQGLAVESSTVDLGVTGPKAKVKSRACYQPQAGQTVGQFEGISKREDSLESFSICSSFGL